MVDQKIHGMMTYIQGGGGQREKKRGREYRWLCGRVFTNTEDDSGLTTKTSGVVFPHWLVN